VEQQVNNSTTDSVDLTVSYVTPVSNQNGLSVRVEDGRLPNRQLVAGDLFDNSYRQQNVAAVTEWTLTGSSHVSARVGWLRRSYAQLPQRDFKGATSRASYEWRPTGNLTLTAVAQKDISAIEQVNSGLVNSGLVNSGLVLIKGVALRPMLRLTDKVNIAGALEYNNREYRSDPALVLGAVPNRTDRVRSAAVTVSYRPLRTVTLQMALQHETRSSTAAFGDYAANVVSVTARLGF
jgi:hypothetical protein